MKTAFFFTTFHYHFDCYYEVLLFKFTIIPLVYRTRYQITYEKEPSLHIVFISFTLIEFICIQRTNENGGIIESEI